MIETTDALYMSISSSRWNPSIVALIRDRAIHEVYISFQTSESVFLFNLFKR